jgi:hypothetical protein
LAVALLFAEKIRQSAALFWFGLRNVGILYSQAVIPRTIVESPAFLEHGSAEKIVVCAQQVGGLYAFLYELLRTLKSFQIFKTKI